MINVGGTGWYRVIPDANLTTYTLKVDPKPEVTPVTTTPASDVAIKPKGVKRALHYDSDEDDGCDIPSCSDEDEPPSAVDYKEVIASTACPAFITAPVPKKKLPEKTAVSKPRAVVPTVTPKPKKKVRKPNVHVPVVHIDSSVSVPPPPVVNVTPSNANPPPAAPAEKPSIFTVIGNIYSFAVSELSKLV